MTRFTFIFIFFILSQSCAWESQDPSDTFDILYLERTGALSPVYIHGNTKSDVFVIILHGGPGGNGLQYRPGVFEAELEEKYAMVYLDQRGQGMAQGHFDADGLSIDEMVEDINMLVSVLQHKHGNGISLFLMGHSWGGTLGTAYLIDGENQYKFKGWIEVDGAHDFDLMIKSQIPLFEEIGNEQLRLKNNEDFWKETLEKVATIDTNNYSIDDFSTLNKLSFEAELKLTMDSILMDDFIEFINIGVLGNSILFSENPLTSFFTGLQTNNTIFLKHNLIETDFSSSLHKIEIPTLLLWGKYDMVAPPALGHQAMNAISSESKELIIFEGSGHSPMVNEGAEFSQAVQAFIDSHK